MDSENKLTIGYAGSLSFHVIGMRGVRKNFLRDYFWTYHVDNVDFTTRSGAYLFNGIRTGLGARLFQETDLSIELWGLIHPANKKYAEEMGLSNIVNIAGYMDKAKSRKKLLACDVLFLPLECGKDGGKTLFIPGKVFEYLALGKPILCLSNGGDCVEILERSGLGIIVSPYDPVAVAEKLAELIKMKKERSLKFNPDQTYINEFRFNRLTGRLAGVFDQVLKSK